MIEIVLTVCALAAHAECHEQRLPFVSDESLMRCMVGAPPYIAQWADEHPAIVVMRWRCARPGEDEQPT
jgi:hypothetical protein